MKYRDGTILLAREHRLFLALTDLTMVEEAKSAQWGIGLSDSDVLDVLGKWFTYRCPDVGRVCTQDPAAESCCDYVAMGRVLWAHLEDVIQ